MKQIQTDEFSFECIRTNDTLYVDKTDFVHKLVTSATKSFFLSRPRRFGKSLLVSTLKAYFQGRKNLFTDLKISQQQPNQWETYPVIHLDMAQSSSNEGFEETKKKMLDVVTKAAIEHNINIKTDSPSIALNTLTKELFAKNAKPVVILVDEYDKPILDALHTSWANRAVALCQEFYQNLKSNLEIERFVFVTGVSKFAHTSLFSGFNNLTDISRDSQYAHIVGYTEDELKYNFAEYITITANHFGCSNEYLLSEIKHWYDGHRFTTDPNTLYNPVSVGQFFQKKEFLNFWVETANPSFLIAAMKNNPFTLDEYINKWYSFDYFSSCNIENINPVALAIQTGYLTISDTKREGLILRVKYDYPNFEISQSWNEAMMQLAFKNADKIISHQDDLMTAISFGDCEKLMDCIKFAFSGAAYEKIGDISIHEGYYRNMLYMLFSGFNMRKVQEEETSTGRVDFAASNNKHAYVIELKVSDGATETNKLIDQAFKQAQDGHYGEKYKLESEHVHLIAVVFDRKTRQLVSYKVKDI